MKSASVSLLVVLFMAGCLDGSPSEEVADDVRVPDAFELASLFSVRGCIGYELADEWVGPNGPTGPEEAPPGWQDLAGAETFSIGFQAIFCDRIGWGPLDRGPVWMAFEYHNKYNAPRECTEDLPELTHRFYIHHFYTNDPEVAAYARSWNLTTSLTEFSEDANVVGGVSLRMTPEDGDPTTFSIVPSHPLQGPFGDATVAYMWAAGERVHRLAVFQEGETTFGDVSNTEWGAPTIMSDRPGPTTLRVSVLSNMRWDGDLVAFTDETCSGRVAA